MKKINKGKIYGFSYFILLLSLSFIRNRATKPETTKTKIWAKKLWLKIKNSVAKRKIILLNVVLQSVLNILKVASATITTANSFNPLIKS